MAEGMDDPLNSGRIPPFDDGCEGADPQNGDGAARAGFESSRRPLTHRPRNLAQLTPSALKSPSSVSAASYPATAPDLRPFADQLVAIADKLRRGDFGPAGKAHKLPALSSNSAQHIAPSPADTLMSESDPATIAPEMRRQTYAEMARVAYAKRRKRVTIFGDPELFGEPAWDILLDLYVAQVEGKTVSVSSACIGSASPPTTGLRWLGVLADQGLLEREHDPRDQRRVLVRLTEKALDAMDDYFANSAGLAMDRRSSTA